MTEDSNDKILEKLNNLQTKHFNLKYTDPKNNTSIFETLIPSLLLIFSAMAMFYEVIFNISMIIFTKTSAAKKIFSWWFKINYQYLDLKSSMFFYYNTHITDTNKSLINEKLCDLGNKLSNMIIKLRELIINENKEYIEAKINELTELNNMSSSDENINNINLMYGGD